MRLDKIVKQAQKLQAQMAEVQKRLTEMRFDPSDTQMLEDLIVAAVNESRRKAQEKAAEEMSSLTGGLAMPGLFGPTS